MGGKWGSVDGMIGGGNREKLGYFLWRWIVEDDGYSQRREERENGGITCYVSGRRRLTGTQE